MDGAEIYIATCNTTGLKYVGATKKILATGTPWGYIKRWEAHIKDAKYEKDTNQNCSLFHQAINQYGENDFIIEKIIDCNIRDMDDLEQHYIIEHNTLHPDGYNMSTGGRSTTFCEKARENMREGQLGKRYTHTVERKNKNDSDLPKHITAIRKDKELLGYQVKKFPIGTDKKEYIYKTFKNKANPDEALQNAIQYMAQLTILYSNRLDIKKDEAECSSKAKSLDLPEFIYPIETFGYYVKGLNDYANYPIPRRDFATLDKANEYIESIKKFNDLKKIPFRWAIVNADNIDELIPTFIEKSTYAATQNGYTVNYTKEYDDNKKPIKITKKFTGPQILMEEKYQSAIKYIKDIIESQSS